MAPYSFVPMRAQFLDEYEGWTFWEFFPHFGVEAYRESLAAGGDPPSGPGGCDGYAVLDEEGVLVGIFEYWLADDADATIGLALRPDLTGRGLGAGFLDAGIRFLVERYAYDREWVALSVAPDNVPAVRLYERVGFELVGTDGTDLRMRKRIRGESGLDQGHSG